MRRRRSRDRCELRIAEPPPIIGHVVGQAILHSLTYRTLVVLLLSRQVLRHRHQSGTVHRKRLRDAIHSAPHPSVRRDGFGRSAPLLQRRRTRGSGNAWSVRTANLQIGTATQVGPNRPARLAASRSARTTYRAGNRKYHCGCQAIGAAVQHQRHHFESKTALPRDGLSGTFHQHHPPPVASPIRCRDLLARIDRRPNE